MTCPWQFSVQSQGKKIGACLRNWESELKTDIIHTRVHLKPKYIVNHLHLLQAAVPWLLQQEATCWHKVLWSDLGRSTSFSRTRRAPHPPQLLASNVVVAPSKYCITGCYCARVVIKSCLYSSHQRIRLHTITGCSKYTLKTFKICSASQRETVSLKQKKWIILPSPSPLNNRAF